MAQGVALAQQNKPDDAASSLKQALALAPDDNARNQVKELIAKLTGAPSASASMQAASAATPKTAKISATPAAGVAAKSPAAASSPAAVAAKGTAAASSPAASPAMAAKAAASPEAAVSTSSEDEFHDAVETMVRGLPIAGPKVTTVEWPEKLKAKVFMDSFPMDQMPPFAKAKFLTDLKAGIDSAKKDKNISSPVEVNIVDGASGHVMETVTE